MTDFHSKQHFHRASRPKTLPKSLGLGGAGSISLGFERYNGFFELVCTRFCPPGSSIEHVSKDMGQRSSKTIARRERKIALLVFFLALENATVKNGKGLTEIARGGLHSWCHSLYRLSVHNPKEGAGNKWLSDVLGLKSHLLDDPFANILRFIQCRRTGSNFIIHLDQGLFDPESVMISVWENESWSQSVNHRTEVLYDLLRQVPRWEPLAGRLLSKQQNSTPVQDIPLRGPWEDMPLYFRYVTAATKIRLVGLNHQVFRRARCGWLQQRKGTQIDLSTIGIFAESKELVEKRIQQEINLEATDEPFSDDLEELTVFIGNPVAHANWQRNTGWRPESYDASGIFWQRYLYKIAQLRPKAKIRLYAVDDISPLVLYLEFHDGAAFLKWTPAMFGTYHPGNPGWNLLWNVGAPPPPHFKEIVYAMNDLSTRAKALPID